MLELHCPISGAAAILQDNTVVLQDNTVGLAISKSSRLRGACLVSLALAPQVAAGYTHTVVLLSNGQVCVRCDRHGSRPVHSLLQRCCRHFPSFATACPFTAEAIRVHSSLMVWCRCFCSPHQSSASSPLVLCAPPSVPGSLRCPPSSLPACMHACRPAYLAACLPACLPPCLPPSLPPCLLLCLFAWLPGCLPAFLPPPSLPVCLPTYLHAQLHLRKQRAWPAWLRVFHHRRLAGLPDLSAARRAPEPSVRNFGSKKSN